jgi:ribulose-phosphate 3-epimerase
MPLPERPLVAPSILAADAGRLRDEVREVVGAGARVIHVDVMDGNFEPPITFGAQTVAALRECVDGDDVLLDVHLMVERPERHVTAFAHAGADLITVHAEATPHLYRVLDAINDAGCLAGAAICPATPPSALADVVDLLDLALCMTVSPGWGGQPFIPGSPGRIAALASVLDGRARIEVDGGIDRVTAPACVEAGASLLVVGSAIFGTPNPGAAYSELASAVARSTTRPKELV